MPEITLPDIPGPPVLVSLFDGIGGFPLAFSRVGVRTVVTVEIDKQAAGVAAEHYPDAVHYTDVKEVTGADLLAAGFDPRTGRITAGFPCQDLSLAGRRMGLGGARSGLYFEIMRLLDEVFQLTGVRPRWVILENVPGLLSSVCPCPGGGICGRRVTACANGSHTVPGGACGRRRRGDRGRCIEIHGGAMGAVLGELAERGYGYAYRVLDAQHFGVPQRRRRVVIVANSGDWHAPAEVLLEPQGGVGDSAPGRAQAARTARILGGSIAVVGGRGVIANALTANMAGGGGGADDNTAQGGRLVPELADTLVARNAKGSPTSNGDGFTLIQTTGSLTTAGGGPDENRAAVGHIIPFNEVQITHPDNRSRPEPGDPSPTLDPGGRMDVAYALRRDPGGTGQGHNTNYVVADAEVYQGHGGNVGPMGTLRAGEGTVQSGVPFTVTGTVTHALTSEGADASEDGTGRGTPIIADTVTAKWATGSGGPAGDEVQNLAPVAFGHTNGMDPQASEHLAPTMRARHHVGGGSVMQPIPAPDADAYRPDAEQWPSGGVDPYSGDLPGTAVRRLTPVECERLQGYPDGWTAVSAGKPQADSSRYRQLGNSIAVPVFEWVALGIQEFDEAKESAR